MSKKCPSLKVSYKIKDTAMKCLTHLEGRSIGIGHLSYAWSVWEQLMVEVSILHEFISYHSALESEMWSWNPELGIIFHFKHIDWVHTGIWRIKLAWAVPKNSTVAINITSIKLEISCESETKEDYI